MINFIFVQLIIILLMKIRDYKIFQKEAGQLKLF